MFRNGRMNVCWSPRHIQAGGHHLLWYLNTIPDVWRLGPLRGGNFCVWPKASAYVCVSELEVRLTIWPVCF